MNDNDVMILDYLLKNCKTIEEKIEVLVRTLWTIENPNYVDSMASKAAVCPNSTDVLIWEKNIKNKAIIEKLYYELKKQIKEIIIPDGENKKTYNSGTYYIGHFKNNKRDGFGILYSKEGKKIIEGEYKDDKPNGEVIVYDSKEDVLYKGNVKDGKYEGAGTFIYTHKDIFEGTYNHGFKDGYGKLVFNNNGALEGYFKTINVYNDVVNGTYTNGIDTYEGQFEISIQKSRFSNGLLDEWARITSLDYITKEDGIKRKLNIFTRIDS